ncbi:hypothetical protein Tco_0257550 [Tanacetum coccineum]|uniref:Uncharacterized protein n=1 Tax=Tanacetum coccineum TaxID=301880 RepID=A0ABQ5AY41_9ASTR
MIHSCGEYNHKQQKKERIGYYWLILGRYLRFCNSVDLWNVEDEQVKDSTKNYLEAPITGREDDNGKIGRLEKKPSGMVIIEEYSGDEMINGVKYEEEKDSLSPSPTPNSGGGLFNQLINNLVSPRASEPREHVFEPESDKNGHVSGGENGGV